MVELLKKIYNGGNLSQQDLEFFISEYCKLMGKEIPNVNQINTILKLIHLKIFDLEYMIENACRKLDLTIYKIIKNNTIIKVYLE